MNEWMNGNSSLSQILLAWRMWREVDQSNTPESTQGCRWEEYQDHRIRRLSPHWQHLWPPSRSFWRSPVPTLESGSNRQQFIMDNLLFSLLLQDHRLHRHHHHHHHRQWDCHLENWIPSLFCLFLNRLNHPARSARMHPSMRCFSSVVILDAVSHAPKSAKFVLFVVLQSLASRRSTWCNMTSIHSFIHSLIHSFTLTWSLSLFVSL